MNLPPDGDVLVVAERATNRRAQARQRCRMGVTLGRPWARPITGRGNQ